MTGRAPDPAALEIFRLQIEGIAERMQDALVRAAFSPIAREGMDCAAALFLADGRVIAQARSLPLLLGSLIPAVRGLTARFPVATMAADDAFILNDPWSGGTHLPDITLVTPVVVEGVVVALSATILHHQDLGGMAPGSVPPDACEIYQEGLRIPPCRWRHGGVVEVAIVDLLCANSRTPEILLGDLGAQWAAASLGARELGALAARLGAAAFAAAGAALIAQAAALTRAALAATPDGIYRHDDALDGDGIDARPVPITVTLRKAGEHLEIDFSGTAPQVAGPVNAPPAGILSAAFFLIRSLAPEAPSNHGCLEPVRLILPPGSLVNPNLPAAVNARTATVKLACNAMLAAWAQADAAAAPAANSGVAAILSVGGTRDDGTRFFFTEIIAGGAGAGPGWDGASGTSTDIGNGKNLPAEILEMQAPIRVVSVAEHDGSGGAGRRCGGNGQRRIYELRAGRATVSYRSERHETRPPGAQGGGAGACSAARVIRRDGSIETLNAKARFDWFAGDRLIIETAGGGGWGPSDAVGAPSIQRIE